MHKGLGSATEVAAGSGGLHPDQKTEQAYFKNARLWASVLKGLQLGNPEVKAEMVFPLVGYLNSLHVTVNSGHHSPGPEVVKLTCHLKEH